MLGADCPRQGRGERRGGGRLRPVLRRVGAGFPRRRADRARLTPGSSSRDQVTELGAVLAGDAAGRADQRSGDAVRLDRTRRSRTWPSPGPPSLRGARAGSAPDGQDLTSASSRQTKQNWVVESTAAVTASLRASALRHLDRTRSGVPQTHRQWHLRVECPAARRAAYRRPSPSASSARADAPARSARALATSPRLKVHAQILGGGVRGELYA